METARTKLRRLGAADFVKIRRLETDPAVMRFTPSRIPQTEAQTRSRLISQIEKQKDFAPFGIWVAEEKGTEEFLGWFMLLRSQEKELELGFMLVQTQWGRGFATEIGEALIALARKNKMPRIIARASIDNLASIRVLEKLGFRYTETISIFEKGFAEAVELKLFEIQLA